MLESDWSESVHYFHITAELPPVMSNSSQYTETCTADVLRNPRLIINGFKNGLLNKVILTIADEAGFKYFQSWYQFSFPQ